MSTSSPRGVEPEPSVPVIDGSRVSAGHPARYSLRAAVGFAKSISLIWILARRRVPLLVAKRAAGHLLLGEAAIVDLPMLEDAARFERELRELGVTAERRTIAPAAG
jgi:hypothetical protein